MKVKAFLWCQTLVSAPARWPALSKPAGSARGGRFEGHGDGQGEGTEKVPRGMGRSTLTAGRQGGRPFLEPAILYCWWFLSKNVIK